MVDWDWETIKADCELTRFGLEELAEDIEDQREKIEAEKLAKELQKQTEAL